MDKGNEKVSAIVEQERTSSPRSGWTDSWRDFHNRMVSTLQGLATAGRGCGYTDFLSGSKQMRELLPRRGT